MIAWRLPEVPRVMGVLNVTPDSFSDGNAFSSSEAFVERGLQMVEEGADIVDVGGESTRPGALPVSEAEELRRVVPVVRELRRELDHQESATALSVDTSKASVMAAALNAGVDIINDVTALRKDPDAVSLLRKTEASVVLMHMQGSPETMQERPRYNNVVEEVFDFLRERIAWCEDHGIARCRLMVDPGIGFGKTTRHNLTLLSHLKRFLALDVPVLIALSRKRMIGEITGEQKPEKRDAGSHVAALFAAMSGASVLRVHDVRGMRQTLSVAAELP